MNSTQQPIEESVIRKIQNLLTMAERAQGNENEAATAMGLAQQLLAKYNLDLEIVQGTQVAGGTVEEKRDKKTIDSSAMYQWQQDLWKAIAEANFCAYWVTEVSTKSKYADKMIRAKRHVVLGRETNVLAVQIMGVYLCETIQRLLPYPHTQSLSRAANSWRMGCAARLIERITDKAEAMRTNDAATSAQGETVATGTAMVVRSLFEAEKIKNYDARWGEGMWARRLASTAKWEADYAAGEQERIDKHNAELSARLALEAAETPAERAARLSREAKQADKDRRANERYWESQRKRQARERAKIDGTAYRAGSAAGEAIGLDAQIGGSTTKSLTTEK